MVVLLLGHGLSCHNYFFANNCHIMNIVCIQAYLRPPNWTKLQLSNLIWQTKVKCNIKDGLSSWWWRPFFLPSLGKISTIVICQLSPQEQCRLLFVKLAILISERVSHKRPSLRPQCQAAVQKFISGLVALNIFTFCLYQFISI